MKTDSELLENSDDGYGSKREECQHCNCKDRPDIKALKNLKRNVTIGKYSVTFAYSILCGIAAAMGCAETGPGAVMCGIAAGAICAFVFGALIDASVEDIVDDIHWTMDNLGCSCAIYCD